MKITVVTLFPEMVRSFFNESIIHRAIEKNQVEIDIVNLRDFATDKYKTVDDKPYGGSAGMVLKVDILHKAIDQFKISNLKFNIKEKIVLTSPRGTVYNQKKAKDYSKLDHLIIIAGHYEGIDERVSKYIDEEVSVGDFVLTGGEIAAAAIVDSVVRLMPGVLKKDEATENESFFNVSIDTLIKTVGEHEVLHGLKQRGVKTVQLLEYPHYTRPETYDGQIVPEVLLSGHHAEIERWRMQKAFELTLARRRDLLERTQVL